MKKFGAMMTALAAGVLWTAGSAMALDGYLMGDPAPGKLVPFYRADSGLATLIGIENTEEDEGPNAIDANDVLVHVTVFTRTSVEVTDFELCLSPFDFGFIVLQDPEVTDEQLAELAVRGHKARVLSREGDLIPEEGYVSIATVDEYDSNTGTCVGRQFEAPFADEQLATWAILADVGDGSFATEIPTPTVNIDTNPDNSTYGDVFGGPGAYGLIPEDNRVIARFDVNPDVDSVTQIYVWLASNGNGTGIRAFLDCEDEFEQSTTINLNQEVNIIDPDTLPGINQCKLQGQFRGVLRFDMPDTGFLWSHITQVASSFRQNYIGYNLDENEFLTPCTPGTIPPCN